MNTSESVIQIAPALLKAQKSLQVAIKDSKNPHFGSSFADLTSVIEVAQPALNDADIVFLQPPSFREGRVVVTTILMHSSGEWISEDIEIPLVKQDAQAVGSCVSYGRRYGLQSFLGIRAEDDDGNKASEAKTTQQETRRAPSQLTQQLRASVDANPEAEDPDDIDAFLGERPPVYDFEQPPAVVVPIKRQSGPVISEAQGKRFFGIAMGSGKSKADINHYLAKRGYAATSDIQKADYEAVCEWAGAR